MVLNAVLGGILGLILGSLIDCIANRSLTKRSFWKRSECENCHKKLSPFDLFPILSYLLVKGRCRYCHKKISIESTLVELITAVLLSIMFIKFLPTNWLTISQPDLIFTLVDLVFKVFVVSILEIFIITDLKVGLIPDRISKPAILTSLIYLFVLCSVEAGLLYFSLGSNSFGKLLIGNGFFLRNALWDYYPLVAALIGAILIGLFFGGLIFFTKGRGMGGGDLKLGIFLGLALNFPSSLAAILIAFLSGSIAGIVLILFQKKKFGQTIPFGPFLSLGGILVLLWGQDIINWYLNFHF